MKSEVSKPRGSCAQILFLQAISRPLDLLFQSWGTCWSRQQVETVHIKGLYFFLNWAANGNVITEDSYHVYTRLHHSSREMETISFPFSVGFILKCFPLASWLPATCAELLPFVFMQVCLLRQSSASLHHHKVCNHISLLMEVQVSVLSYNEIALRLAIPQRTAMTDKRSISSYFLLSHNFFFWCSCLLFETINCSKNICLISAVEVGRSFSNHPCSQKRNSCNTSNLY